MARKRASKKRVDYRKGGRVSVRTGGRQFGELDAIMPKSGRRLSNKKLKKDNTPPNPSNEGVEARGQIDQSKFAMPESVQLELDAINKAQQNAAGSSGFSKAPTSGTTTKLNPDADPRMQQAALQRATAFSETQEGNDGSQITDNLARLEPQQAQSAVAQEASQPFKNKARTTTKVDKRGRTIQVGETGRGRMGQYNNVGETVELTDEQQAEVDRIAAEEKAKQDAKAAAEAADPTKNDPAKQLMNRVGTEEFPTYSPTKPDVSKLNVGKVTEKSSDAAKLKAGISTDVQQLATDGTMPQIDDPTKVTAKQPTAGAGEAGSADAPDRTDANVYDAVDAEELDPTIAAQGKVTREAKARGPKFRDRNRVDTATRDARAEEEALAGTADYKIDPESLVKKVEGETAQVVQTAPAEKQQRELQLGMPAPDGDAAQIINEFGFGNSMKPRLVQGAKAKQAAADKLASDHDLDPEVANQIMEDVEGFKIEGQSQESLGAVAALPKEALVSTQMENLVAGMEEGKPPSWARPAVAAVEQMMAQRGLSASSVGRDALFNAYCSVKCHSVTTKSSTESF